jgi:hypothetical protein
VKNRRQREADESRRERAAEDHDGGVIVDEHPQIAAHQNQGGHHAGTSQKAESRSNIHELNHPVRNARRRRPRKRWERS